MTNFLFLVVLPFIVWMISWSSFITGKYAIGGDAFYYYWDSRYFLDNISRGVYPLWNSDYSGGVPWNFFLRRMGEINPFYWIINGLKFLGLSALHAHLIFLVFYFFLAFVGFWLLSRLILKDRLASTCACLLLLFSWGGRIFFCFDILMFVPLVWFFYFILAFAKEQKKHQFLGGCFAAALMIGTYIPFFTLTIIGSLLILFFLFFMKESFDFFKVTLRFIRTHRIFAGVSLGFFLLACVPAVNFYLESRVGGFVMPTRHLGSTDSSQVAISCKTNAGAGGVDVSRTVWDIIAHGYFDNVFSNQQEIGMGDFNIAYLFFIALMVGVINPVSRRTALLLVAAVFLMLTAMTKGRLYPFFLDHIFFFRYMRMLQLFLWLAVLPLAILLAMEQLRVFLRDHRGRRNIKVLIFVSIVHVLFLVWLLMQEGVFWCSYLAVGMSLVFFILAIMGWGNRLVVDIWLWLSLLIQPFVMQQWIYHNSPLENLPRLNDRMSLYQGNFALLKKVSLMPTAPKGQANEVSAPSSGYYENFWLNNIKQSINQENLQRFIENRLLLFDNTMAEDEFLYENSYAKLSKIWGSLQNLALVPWDPKSSEEFRTNAPKVLKAQVVLEGSPEVKVVSFDANTLRLETHLNRPRFLLWANGYHPGWHVYIDGRQGRLLRADFAFKGAWIPAGDHTVVFQFATPVRYAMAYILLFVFLIVFIVIVLFGFREGLLVEKEETSGH